MQRDVKFQMEEVSEIPDWADAYPEHKFTVYKCCFLSTKPNSHELNITDEVLREYADTILGNFLVAKVQFGDAMSHESDEIIYGYFPREQEIEFVDVEGITKAYAYAVVSKRYSKEFNGIFEFDNIRNSSVEMAVTTTDEDKDDVVSFDIYALTCLGKSVNGSCPDADIKMVRFTAEEADAYFAHTDTLSNLKQFVETRKQSMAEKKTYKIDKSKEAMSDADWGDVDKSALRDKIMDAANRATLVKSVYMLVEDGWEDAPSEHLKYPVMQFDGDTLVYNRNALASALGYAKKEGEDAVVNKVEKIYKKLDLDDNSEGKEEKMEEIKESVEMAEVEEPKQDEAEMAKPVAEEVMADPIEHDDDEDDDCEHKMSEDEMLAKIAQLEKDIEDRDHIIMERDTELADLRAYKAAILAKENATRVDGIMEEIKAYITDEQFASFREEGLACDESNIDAWSNKVKAVCFSEVKKNIKKDDSGVFSFAMPTVTKKVESNSIWDRLENK